MSKNIGFISTRFAGTDGVSLEAAKWAAVLARSGHRIFWFAGELDTPAAQSLRVPRAHFSCPENCWINDRILGRKGRHRDVTRAIQREKSYLKTRIYRFIQKFELDLLVTENALTLPMQVPLGIALTETIAETLLPTIAHHHDFYWERTRYAVNAVGDYMHMAFPPKLYNIEHVVINSTAQEELAHRTGISSTIIPNVLDFENPPTENDPPGYNIRKALNLAPDDVIILQPTRIVQRKGIEHAIDLVEALKSPRYKLVISHEAGDEGFEYAQWLRQEARGRGVDLRMLKMQAVASPNNHSAAPRQLALWDIYPQADFITYPSLYEGFGNAFLEAIYFKKPLLINRYAIFVRDIEPQGFDLIVMDGFLTQKTIRQVKKILDTSARKEKMVAHNYEIARRHYSYSLLEEKLKHLLVNFFGANS